MAPPFPEVPGTAVQHRFVDAGGLRMHVAEAGPSDGDPVVLVHGWPQHWWLWRELIPPLAAEHRVLCPDLRGLGWTDAPRDGYDKETLAGDLLALLDALGLARVTLAGHDWGALAGLLLCLRAPERVSGFVALSIPHLWATRPDPRRVAGLTHMPFLSTVPAVVPPVATAALRLGRARGAYTDTELATYVDVLREPARARASVGYYRTFLLHELRPLLSGRYRERRLEVPTTLLMGERDPVGWGADLEGANAEELVPARVPRAAHFLPEEAPGEVLRAVRSRAMA